MAYDPATLTKLLDHLEVVREIEKRHGDRYAEAAARAAAIHVARKIAQERTEGTGNV
jgi:hypothetical protein